MGNQRLIQTQTAATDQKQHLDKRTQQPESSLEEVLSSRAASRYFRAQLQQHQAEGAASPNPLHSILPSISPVSPRAIQAKPKFRGLSHELTPALDSDGMAATQDLESSVNRARGSGQPLETGLQHNAGAVQRSPLPPPQLPQHPATETPSASESNRAIQAKGEMTGNSQVSSEVKRPNQNGLPDHLKTSIEDLSGYSMDDVRVHYNSDQPAQLQAHAYTKGTDIHVASGQEKHLPHEAWHVVQQMQGRVKPTMQMKGVQVNDDKGLEKEADLMGTRAVQKEEGMHDSRPDSISPLNGQALNISYEKAADKMMDTPLPRKAEAKAMPKTNSDVSSSISVIQRTVSLNKGTNEYTKLNKANEAINALSLHQARQASLKEMGREIVAYCKQTGSDLDGFETKIKELEEAIEETTITINAYKTSLDTIKAILEGGKVPIQALPGFQKRYEDLQKSMLKKDWEEFTKDVNIDDRSEFNKLKEIVSLYDSEVVAAREAAAIAKKEAAIAKKIEEKKAPLRNFFKAIDFDLDSAIKNKSLMNNILYFQKEDQDTLKKLIRTYGEASVLEQLKKKDATAEKIREGIQQEAGIAYHPYNSDKAVGAVGDLQDFANKAKITLDKLITDNPSLKKGSGDHGEKTKASMQLLENGNVIDTLNYSVYVSGGKKKSNFTYDEVKTTEQGANKKIGETSLQGLTYAAGPEGHVHARKHDTEVKILERTLAFLKERRTVDPAEDLSLMTLRVFVSRYTCPSCSDLFYKAKNAYPELRELGHIHIVYTEQAF
jgi:Domain of unknown function (DUF4157)